MHKVTLPWPPTALSPNSRVHWRALAKAKKQYRHACAWQAVGQGVRRVQAERLAVHFIFYPPSRRRIDVDNCIASIKSGIDGLAEVLGVDDSCWDMTFELAKEIGGMIKVSVRQPLEGR